MHRRDMDCPRWTAWPRVWLYTPGRACYLYWTVTTNLITVPFAVFLEKLFKWTFLISLAVTLVAWLFKDSLPAPDFYANSELAEPLQTPVQQEPFSTTVNGQTYIITPRFDYQLQGVIVSQHDADSFLDITHFKEWQDYLNLRDLCVIWGDNLRSGVYQDLRFWNDSWTCWVQWNDRATGARFKKDQLSNNHLLTDRPEIQAALMAAEPGDHIRLRGMLVEYANPGNGFQRGTSTTRRDTGNGACETIYVTDFAIVEKANSGIRKIYELAFWLMLVALVGFIIFFFVAPAGKRVH